MHIVVREAIVNKQCNQLRLNRNKISSVGVSIIAKILNENTTLKTLVLSYNDLGDMSVHCLAKSLSLNHSSLDQLYLDSTGITDEGARYLAEMLKSNSTLKSVFLDKNNIGDRGIELLANALIHHNSTLIHINLDENKLVSDESVDILVQMLQQNRSLSYLHMFKCNLSKKGKDRLRQVIQTKTDFNLNV
jgi:Ran GTPase-activating protein (RanGAP) involved in mRNA processing and transport